MNRSLPLLFGTFAAGAALAAYEVEMNAIDIKGVGAPIGTVTVTAAPGGGVMFKPQLQGLPPGPHGFHIHEFPNCAARERDGKMQAGALAGGHWDPKKTGKHGRPDGDGHLGDLPALEVDASGRATKPVTAPRLALGDLGNKSLMIHAGGDNYSDQPKPLGGGGERIACGIIKPYRKP